MFLLKSREPGSNASAEKLLNAVDNRMQKALRKPERLARERLHMVRGLVAPLADYVAVQTYSQVAGDIRRKPLFLDFTKERAMYPFNDTSTCILAALQAEKQLVATTRDFLRQLRKGQNDPFNLTEKLVEKYSPIYFPKLVRGMEEAISTGFAFPMNFSATYMYQRTGCKDRDIIKGRTPQQYIDTLASNDFERSLYTATLARNGFWRAYSSEIKDNNLDLAYPIHGEQVFTPNSPVFSPDLKKQLLENRRQCNKQALKIAAADNTTRLSNGCPAARPHVGPPNLFERASVKVLESIGATPVEICQSMQGASIKAGINLGILVCETVRDQGMEFPSLETINYERVNMGMPIIEHLKPYLM